MPRIGRREEGISDAILSDWESAVLSTAEAGRITLTIERALSAVIGLRTTVPADAFTAKLSSERAAMAVLRGNGSSSHRS